MQSDGPPAPSLIADRHSSGFVALDSSARRLQLQRRKRLTADEESELDRINRELGASAARVEVA